LPARRGVVIAVLAACAVSSLLLTVGRASAAPGDIQSVDLTLLGKSSLPSPGLDGQTKPRGQNNDVAAIGNTAFVGGGSATHGARSTPGRICVDYGGVKVVDISDPANPTVKTTINIEDPKGAVVGVRGNNRRNKQITNVSSIVSTLDVKRFPAENGSKPNRDVLAIATQRCEASFFTGGRIEFWDVTNPSSPSRIGVFDPESIPNPTPGGTPANGAWGIFEEVRMFTRADKPGKVFAVATSPFSVGNMNTSPGGVTFAGDFRLLDVSNPAAPTQVDTFPKTGIGQDSNNGCRNFQAGRNAAPTPDGRGAILSWYDGAQPATAAPGSFTGYPSTSERTNLGGPNSAALFNLNLDNLPQLTSGQLPGSLPTFNPNPPTYGYPVGTDTGLLPNGEVAPEGNIADVQPFTGPNGELMTFASEEDYDPALTTVSITGPAPLAASGRGCIWVGSKKPFELPGQQVSGDVAYVGRGCPASNLERTTLRSADPYLEDPNGKIALVEPGGDANNGCSLAEKVRRAAAAGATGVLNNLGPILNLNNASPTGGLAPVPPVGILDPIFQRMAGYVPNRILAGTVFPANWVASTAGAVTVKPLASQIQCPAPANIDTCDAAVDAGPGGPIQIRTAANHGLANGDVVKISGVTGNLAANGEWTVTLGSVNPTTTFTLNGSASNGTSTGGGTVARCIGGGNCPVDPGTARTDFSRFRSVASAADRVARGSVNPIVFTTTADVGPGATQIPVAALPGPIPSGSILRFDNGVVTTASLAAAAGATSLTVGTTGTNLAVPVPLQSAVPSGTQGSLAFKVTGGQQFRAGAFLEVASRVDGTFRAAVEWFDAAGTSLGDGEIQALSAVTSRTKYTQTVTAPAGAVRGTVKFEWTGATADGTAFADSFFLVPAGLQAKVQDGPGFPNTGRPEWGAQRIVDFSGGTPAQVGEYRSPRSLVWPPPAPEAGSPAGIYAPAQARLFGRDLAFSTWMSDGLRALDISKPSAPRELASFVPPAVEDPSDQAGPGRPTERTASRCSVVSRGRSCRWRAAWTRSVRATTPRSS